MVIVRIRLARLWLIDQKFGLQVGWNLISLCGFCYSAIYYVRRLSFLPGFKASISASALLIAVNVVLLRVKIYGVGCFFVDRALLRAYHQPPTQNWYQHPQHPHIQLQKAQGPLGPFIAPFR
jgi:hypothetical protein